MKGKLLPGLLLLLAFAACKKDKKTAPVIYSVIGTFTLSSYQTNFGVGVNADVNQYPCMAYNTLTFYRDYTASSGYFGLDSCFITPTHLPSAGAQVVWAARYAADSATWRQNGNNIYVTYAGNSQPAPRRGKQR